MKTIHLDLSLQEIEHIVTSVEGAIAEFEILCSDLPWFTSESIERLQTTLMILESKRLYE